MTLASNLSLTPRVVVYFVAVVVFVISTINNRSQLVLSTLSTQSINRHCDLELCDSLVNKCKLTNRCSCNFRKDASCAKDCIDCLEEKFGKCCACVENLCPVFEGESFPSHVGFTAPENGENYPLLFENMTETDDIHGRWKVKRSISGLRISHPKIGQVEYAFRRVNDSDSDANVISHDTELEKLECHLAFVNKYLSMTRCKKTCTHMGAAFYRWFHNGCCECVGRYCLNFGIGEPECLIADEGEL